MQADLLERRVRGTGAVSRGAVTERSWYDFVAATVTGPLGMHSTGVQPGGSAASGAGPLSDLLTLAGELLSPDHSAGGAARGRHAGGVSRAFRRGAGDRAIQRVRLGTRLRAQGPEATPLDRHHGLAADVRAFRALRRVLWVDPEAGVACASAGGAAFGPWAVEKWPRFSDAVLSTWSVRPN